MTMVRLAIVVSPYCTEAVSGKLYSVEIKRTS